MRFFALLIGIDDYPLAGDRRQIYESLEGCVRDVDRVGSFLRQQWQVPVARIECLVADGGARSGSSVVSGERMVAAIRRLLGRTRAGDHVWIHFSGHGGRVRTRFPELKGHRGVDEALVPSDIAQPGVAYLRDLELASLLNELVDAQRLVTLVLDCCHSGGAVRGVPIDRQRIRGGSVIDHAARASLLGEPSASWHGASARRGKSGWLPEPRGYVLLAACRAHEAALEGRYDGRLPGGALTHFLLETLATLPTEATYRELYDGILARMLVAVEGQTPILEGDGDRRILGPGRASRQAAAVLAIDLAAREVRVSMGSAHGVSVGTGIALLPPGGGSSREREAWLATASLRQVGATSSWATVTGGVMRSIRPGMPAVVLTLGGGRRRGVRCAAPIDEDAMNALAHALAATSRCRLLRADSQMPAAQVPAAQGPADFVVRLGASGLEVCAPDGLAVVGVEPVACSDPDAARILAGRIEHLARFDDVARLAPPNAAVNDAGLEIRLETPSGAPLGAPVGDPVTVRRGEITVLRIANVSERVLQVTALDLDRSNWSISSIFPAAGDFRPLEPRQVEHVPLTFHPASGRPEGAETIKAFGTRDATRFGWLALPPMGEPLRDRWTIPQPAAAWTVAQLEVRVRP